MLSHLSERGGGRGFVLVVVAAAAVAKGKVDMDGRGLNEGYSSRRIQVERDHHDIVDNVYT